MLSLPSCSTSPFRWRKAPFRARQWPEVYDSCHSFLHAFRVQFSHVRVFSDSRNVQKRATKSDTSGHCLPFPSAWRRRPTPPACCRRRRSFTRPSARPSRRSPAPWLRPLLSRRLQGRRGRHYPSRGGRRGGRLRRRGQADASSMDFVEEGGGR